MCGATAVQPPVMPAEQTPVEQPTPTEPEPLQVSSDTLPDQQYGQTQAYVPPAQQPKKSKTGLIVALVLIIVVVVVIAVVLLFVFQGGLPGSDESKLVGTWEYDMMFASMEWKFNADKTLEIWSMGYTSPVGSWSLSNGKLIISAGSGEYSTYAGEYTYYISPDGKTLTLNDYMTFTKK